jgi:hypothetical protein
MNFSNLNNSFSVQNVPFYKDHFYEIISVVVVIIGALTFFAILNINFNEKEDKRIQKIVTIESFDTILSGDTICSNTKSPSEINSLCNQLTKKNCKLSSCCVLLNGEKCVGGNKEGPTFYSEKEKKINIDYYYYKDKCFGNCPK